MPSNRRFVESLFRLIVFTGLALLSVPVQADRLFVDPMFGVSVTSDVQFATKPDHNGNVNLLLDVYQPTGANVPAQLPAIVLMHGGYFVSDNKTTSPMVDLANAFASRGYVAVSINYRLLLGLPEPPGAPITPALDRIPDWLYPELLDPFHFTLDQYAAEIAAAVSDQGSAVDWLRANAATYNINPDQIAAGGFSAGAVSSLMLGAGAVDGVTAQVGAVFSMAGGMFGLESSVDSSDPGVFILHGTADDTVPFSEVGYMEDAFTTAGVPFAEQILPGAGHGSSGLRNALLANPDPLFEFMAGQLGVPEPSSYALLLVGLATLIAVGRRR